MFRVKNNMAYTSLIVLDPDMPEMKGNSGTDGAKLQGNKIINSPSATAVIMQILVWLSCD